MSTRKFFAGLVAMVAVFAVVSTVDAQSYQFNTNLTVGSTGMDVVNLQSFLESKGYLTIPAGTSKGYFGTLTQTALARYQAANNITPAAGYFGPLTRASVNLMMQTGGGTSTPGMTCPPGFTPGVFNGVNVCLVGNNNSGTSSNNGSLRGGEASLEDFDFKNGDQTDLDEGMEGAEVAEIEFDVEDADVRVERVDVHFEFTGSGSADDEPWEVFDMVSLMAGNTELDSVDASDEDNWSDEGSDVYRLRFTGLDTVVREGDKANMTVVVDVASNVDGVLTAEWTLFVPADGVRAIDGEGIDQEIGRASDTVVLEFDEEGSDDELTVRESDDNPDGGTLQVEDDRSSDWHTVLVFELEAEESDIEVTEIPLTIYTTGGSTTDDVVNDMELVIDGETFDDYTLSATNATLATSTFDIDDEDLVIEADDTVTVEVRVKFNAQDGNYPEGQFFSVELTSSGVEDIEAEGADDLDADQLSGSADGEDFTLRTAGLTVSTVTTDSDVRTNVDATSTDDQGVYTITFDVMAFEETAFIALNAASGTAENNTGVSYLVEGSTGASVGAGVSTSILERVSGGSVDGNYVRVNEGQTARLRLTVYYDPTTTGNYRAQLYSVNFASTAVDATTQQVVSPQEDYDSPFENVQN